MVEKTIVSILKGLAAVVYTVLLVSILSSPAIFIYQAFRPPVFTFNGAEIKADLTDDEYLKGTNRSPEDWVRIDYSLSASSGRFSPYYYRVDTFVPDDETAFPETGSYMIVLDEPLYFTNTVTDDFVISLYIKDDGKTDIEELTKSMNLKAKNYEKGFFEFAAYYEG